MEIEIIWKNREIVLGLIIVLEIRNNFKTLHSRIEMKINNKCPVLQESITVSQCSVPGRPVLNTKRPRNRPPSTKMLANIKIKLGLRPDLYLLYGHICVAWQLASRATINFNIIIYHFFFYIKFPSLANECTCNVRRTILVYVLIIK